MVKRSKSTHRCLTMQFSLVFRFQCNVFFCLRILFALLILRTWRNFVIENSSTSLIYLRCTNSSAASEHSISHTQLLLLKSGIVSAWPHIYSVYPSTSDFFFLSISLNWTYKKKRPKPFARWSDIYNSFSIHSMGKFDWILKASHVLKFTFDFKRLSKNWHRCCLHIFICIDFHATKKSDTSNSQCTVYIQVAFILHIFIHTVIFQAPCFQGKITFHHLSKA